MCREDHHGPLEPPEEPPFCDRCFGYHAWNASCPEDELDDEEED